MQDKQQNKNPFNDKGQPHGLWEIYFSNGQLCYKCTYKKSEHIGYYQQYKSNGSIKQIRFYAR